MKAGKWFIISTLGAMLFLFSCKAVFIIEISRAKSFNLKSITKKTATVVGLDGANQIGFSDKFQSKNPQKHFSTADYTNLFAHRLQHTRVFSKVKPDTTNNWSSFTLDPLSKENSMAADSLIKICVSDYLVCISEYETSKRFQTYRRGPTYSSTEFVVVRAHFKIWDVKAHIIALDFMSIGEGIVILSETDSAFNEAIKSSIDHAVEFLETGKKKFIILTTESPTRISWF